nr:hypothetical protein [Akkermansia muciniphila]
MVVIAIIALLASVAYGPILNQINKGDQMQALTNMKNVGVAMNEFKANSKLGNFPDDITADRVVAQHNYMSGLGALQGDTSNDYFRQLLGNESVSESNFYAKVQTPSGGSTVTPNGEIYDGQALTPGEVGISYVMRKGDNNKKVGIGSSVGEYPLMVTSVLPGEDGSTVVAGNAVRFDPESFRGKVLIFTTAQSAKTLELDDNDNLQDTFIPKRRGKDISDQFLILTPDFSGQE